jgi:DNA-binding PadR family transcriptional regulator
MIYDENFIENLTRHPFFTVGRHPGGHGFAHGGFGFRGGRGGGDFPWGRKLGSKDLQLLILALLGERPAHGYELIKTIEDRSRGFYSPSPGMIYPALTLLDEIGHASIQQEGSRKLYSITPEGAAYLASNRAAADAILETLSRIGGRMDDVREAFAGGGDADGGDTDEIHHARHALKDALRRKRGCTPDEARRIAKILNHATSEILGNEARHPHYGKDHI